MFIPIRDDNPGKHFPVVSLILIIANVLIFLVDRGFVPWGPSRYSEYLTMVPLEFLGDFERANGVKPFWVSLFSAMFMHANLQHLVGNMWYLWLFGNNVEDAFGRARFLILYLACGIAAGFLHIAVTASPATPTLGASGAMAGVLGAYMVLFPKAEVEGLWWFLFIYLPGQLPAIVMLGLWFVLQFLAFQPGVAYWAHIGGFVAGMATAVAARRQLLARARA